MDAAKPLNYAPKPPASQHWVRMIYGSLFCVALIIAGVFFGPTIWGDTTLIFVEHQCLTHALPPDHVVFEIGSGKIIHAEVPAAESKLLGVSTNLVATIYVHRMQLPNGKPVFVDLFAGPLNNWRPQSTHHFAQLCSERWNIAIHFTILSMNYPDFPTFSDDHHWKFFAGQPDPNNPSHFTFDYDVDGNRHACDAWLDNNGKLLISQRP
jgi:hypothetical protein